MQETHVPRELAQGEEPQEGGSLRRIAEEVCDLSQVDLTVPEMRRLLKGAYGVLLKYRSRRLSIQTEVKD
jgi:hypothetical protein